MSRPQLYPVKKVIGFDEAMLKAIDDWRRHPHPASRRCRRPSGRSSPNTFGRRVIIPKRNAAE